MTKTLTQSIVFAILIAAGCSPSQKVLLIGTHHTTPENRRDEVIPIMEALKRFNPEVICGEYPIPTDTISLLYRGGEIYFQDVKYWQAKWKITPDANTIKSLQHHLRKHPSDLHKRMELLQQYYVSHDIGNTAFQVYIVYKRIEHDSAMTAHLSKHFSSYGTFKRWYDNAQVRGTEYHILVFPLAVALNIGYMHPIDDFSTAKFSQKHFDRLQIPDSTDSLKTRYQQKVEDFKKMLASASKENNLWIKLNTPSSTKDLLVLEGYEIDADSLHEDLKMQSYYWRLRNEKMAQHIDRVARGQRNKDVVVFFGVSHVGPVLAELNKLKKKYRVLTLYDILKYDEKL